MKTITTVKYKSRVKNKEKGLKERPHKVSDMLLYARTDEEIVADNEYSTSGNRIEMRTMDLDTDFSEIWKWLDFILGKS